ADDQHYQVSCLDGSQQCVDLGAKSCSCRKWQLSGIPSKHACCAIYYQKQDPVDYVHECYRVETYKKVYAPAIQPMSHEGLWSECCIIPPIPPNFGRGAGRPKKARRRESDEPTLKKKKSKTPQLQKLRRNQKTVHCSSCGEPGHNTAKCPEKGQAGHEVGQTHKEQHGTVKKRKAEKRKATEPAIEALEQATEPTIEAQQATEPATEDLEQDTNIAIEGLEHATNIIEDEQPEACLTQDHMQPQAAPPPPVYMPGPSMFQQLQMTNPLSTLQQRVTIRAPPPFRSRQILPSFSTRPHSGTTQPIIKMEGRSF
ncbi:UNVERIFIED_CONTAM: hypothetical protein Slati_3703600, partial [Sesamum latifolium]